MFNSNDICCNRNWVFSVRWGQKFAYVCDAKFLLSLLITLLSKSSWNSVVCFIVSYFISPVPKKNLLPFFWNTAESGYWTCCNLCRWIWRSRYCVIHLNTMPPRVLRYTKNWRRSFRNKVKCICLNKFILLKDGCIDFLCRFSQEPKNCRFEFLPDELRQG